MADRSGSLDSLFIVCYNMDMLRVSSNYYETAGMGPEPLEVAAAAAYCMTLFNSHRFKALSRQGSGAFSKGGGPDV
jgi:hypothetical protein